MSFALQSRPLTDYALLAEHASNVRTGPDPDAIPEPQRYAAPTYDGPVLLDRVNNVYLGINPATKLAEPLYQGLYLESDSSRDPQGEIIRGTRPDPAFATGEFLVLAGLGAIAGAGIGGALAGGEAGTAAGAEGGEVLGGAESLSGASAESSVAASEVGAETVSEYSFKDIAKGLQTGLNAAKSYQSLRNARKANGTGGVQSATPDYVGFGSSPGAIADNWGPSETQSTSSFSLSPIFLIAIALIAFVFILRR